MQCGGGARRYAMPIATALLVLGLGFWLGSAFFPTIEIHVVERRVEVPVERLVEQRVPYEVIKYVDRVVEKRVEVPVERVVEKRIEVPVEKIVVKRVEVPVEKVVYRDKPAPAKPAGFSFGQPRWGDLAVGMSRAEVRRILGQPREIEGDGASVVESWFYGRSLSYGAPASVRFGVAGVIGWDPP